MNHPVNCLTSLRLMVHAHQGPSTANICEKLVLKSVFSQNPRQVQKTTLFGGYTNERIFKTYSTKYSRTFMKNTFLLMEVVR
jgi:phosphotransferase system IIB component